MKRRISVGMCLLFGLSVCAFELAERVAASEPLPDASVLAQGRRPFFGPMPPRISEVTLSGVIEAVQPNALTIIAGRTGRPWGQKQWLVLSWAGTTELTIHGTATLDYLRKGQTIEFKGQIAKGDKVARKAKEEKVADKVKELTIIARKGELAAKGHVVDPGKIKAPKSETDPETALAVSDDDPDSEAAGIGPKEKIVGKIAARDEMSLTVAAGKRMIHVDLADEPTINVELFDPKLVADKKDASKSKIEGQGSGGRLVTIMAGDLPGSKIVVRGTGRESWSANECTAKSIEVTLAKPLTGKKPTSSGTKKAVADK